MSKIWINPSGKVIIDEDGKIVICDNCPCEEGCEGFASSYLFTWSNSSGTTRVTTLTLAADPDNPGTCTFGAGDSDLPCAWIGEIDSPFGDVHTWLILYLDTPLSNWRIRNCTSIGTSNGNFNRIPSSTVTPIGSYGGLGTKTIS